MTSPRFASLVLIAAASLAACASKTERTAADDFFTSGSRSADQRAEQRVAAEEQIRGESGQAVGSRGEKNEAKRTLYERLGGDSGVRQISDDFVDRAIADPRVNWDRKGVSGGGVLGIGKKSSERTHGPADVARVKDHVAQFIAVASGGPSRYDGRDMKASHAGMRITNAEFDATIGDMKASLDALRVGTVEQKELLSVLESARAQIVEDR